jgi:hypothetical protein
MKKHIIICIIIALVFGSIGFIIGFNIKDSFSLNKKEKDLVGTYRTQDWNGKEGIIVLNKNKTCIHPSGYAGTWYIENGKLYMDVDFPTIASNKEKTLYYETFEKTEKKKIEVLVVEKGLIFSSKFFEKI